MRESKSKEETILAKTAVKFDEIADKRSSISRSVNQREGLDCNITTYPHLNCYHQEDYNLIETIKQMILYHPSTFGSDSLKEMGKHNKQTLIFGFFHVYYDSNPLFKYNHFNLNFIS